MKKLGIRTSQGASPLEIPARPIRGLNSRRSPARGDSRSQEPGVRSQESGVRSQEKNADIQFSPQVSMILSCAECCGAVPPFVNFRLLRQMLSNILFQSKRGPADNRSQSRYRAVPSALQRRSSPAPCWCQLHGRPQRKPQWATSWIEGKMP
jgi:hypothetical protein